MRRVDIDLVLGAGPDPAKRRAAAGEDERMRAVAIDDRQLQILIIGRVGHGLPHRSMPARCRRPKPMHHCGRGSLTLIKSATHNRSRPPGLLVDWNSFTPPPARIVSGQGCVLAGGRGRLSRSSLGPISAACACGRRAPACDARSRSRANGRSRPAIPRSCRSGTR